ncbi:hypothetical protein [Burkholderia ubonensis]|uniref:hypothetical protein n=1 Tax=Burkholderia ubonensis TaxID=101571 RepID=UPI000A4C25D7|nr:hypothetical protein [Burkholderia ubonensis]
MAAQSKNIAPTPETPQPFVVPEGLTIEHRLGPVTGKHMYKVAGFEMPYAGSEEAAVQLYQRLKHAYETGYFNSTGTRKPT